MWAVYIRFVPVGALAVASPERWHHDIDGTILSERQAVHRTIARRQTIGGELKVRGRRSGDRKVEPRASLATHCQR
jgi:hypothetical protein